MPTNDPRWRPRGYCVDCDTTYPLDEAVLHKCKKNEKRRRKFIERQVRTRGGPGQWLRRLWRGLLGGR